MGLFPHHSSPLPGQDVPALNKRRASNRPALPARRSRGAPCLLAPRSSLSAASAAPALSLSKGFTIVEVMMASVILVVGFMGMIQAVTIGSEMLATARRQTLAAQVLNHEMEKLRLTNWTSLPAAAAAATVAIDLQLWPAWRSTSTYAVNEVVAYNGAWYRCTVLSAPGVLPTNPAFWTATTAALPTDIVQGEGVVLTLTRTTTDLIASELKEITLTVSWTKSGTNTAASTTTGSWLQQIAFRRDTPIARTYTRSSTTWFTKYGLNHAIQRS